MSRKRNAPARKGEGVDCLLGRDIDADTNISPIAQPERIILIEPKAFGQGFDVRVIPPVDGENLDAEFSEHRRARGWASGLRMTRGWRIVDRTEVGNGSD